MDPTASATAYGQRPQFVRAGQLVTAEGENCAYGPTLVLGLRLWTNYVSILPLTYLAFGFGQIIRPLASVKYSAFGCSQIIPPSVILFFQNCFTATCHLHCHHQWWSIILIIIPLVWTKLNISEFWPNYSAQLLSLWSVSGFKLVSLLANHLHWHHHFDDLFLSALEIGSIFWPHFWLVFQLTSRCKVIEYN